MKIGELDVSKIYLGGSEISKIMLGTNQVYSGGSEPTPTPYDEQYLTFDIVSGGTINWVAKGSQPRTISYSLDGGDSWSSITSSTAVTSFNVNAGDKVLWKGTNTNYATNISNYSSFSGSTATFNIYGNIMSTLYGDNFIGQTALTDSNAFAYFLRTINVVSAENLIMPTGLSNSCFWYLFKDCTSLTTAPELPATTLASSCYAYMFGGCTSLTSAPVLSATTLVTGCYTDMFSGCTSLNYIKCLATDISASQCTYNWVNGVAATGTFTKAASMRIWTNGDSGIPTGWVVENEGDLPYNAQYLTTESLEDNNTISFTMGTGMTTAITTAVTSVSVSTDDGVTWTSMQNIGASASLSVTLDTGEKALWKGEALGYSTTTAATKSTSFSSTGNYKVYGNITSLLYDDDFLNESNPTLPDFNCFTNLFYGSTGLTDASNLIMHFELPATSKRQLGYLFQGCTSLVNAPELKNIDFGGSQFTFRNMFQNCTSLTVAPELTATTLVNGCYASMFQGCTSLNYIKCLATDISAGNCTYRWVSGVDGVASTGTFVKAASMNDWTSGINGIPNNWTIENDDGSPVGGGDWEQ